MGRLDRNGLIQNSTQNSVKQRVISHLWQGSEQTHESWRKFSIFNNYNYPKYSFSFLHYVNNYKQQLKQRIDGNLPLKNDKITK